MIEAMTPGLFFSLFLLKCFHLWIRIYSLMFLLYYLINLHLTFLSFFFVCRGKRATRATGGVSSQKKTSCSGFWENRAAGIYNSHLITIKLAKNSYALVWLCSMEFADLIISCRLRINLGEPTCSSTLSNARTNEKFDGRYGRRIYSCTKQPRGRPQRRRKGPIFCSAHCLDTYILSIINCDKESLI